jgi:hypothetical protein
MDVDAIMTFGPQVTYSIRPVTFPVPGPSGPVLVTFDGGEIWEYNGAGTPTKFLDHGGHLWNTAFDVRGTFGVLSENVDALEGAAAVPEPSCILLFVIGLLATSRFVRRSR